MMVDWLNRNYKLIDLRPIRSSNECLNSMALKQAVRYNGDLKFWLQKCSSRTGPK